MIQWRPYLNNVLTCYYNKGQKKLSTKGCHLPGLLYCRCSRQRLLARGHGADNPADNPKFESELVRLRDALDDWIESVGGEGERPEIDMVREMRPGLEQPQTATPTAAIDEAGARSRVVALSSETEGASIGYRIDDGPWQLYTAPVRLRDRAVLEARAIRYGYRESKVLAVDPE